MTIILTNEQLLSAAAALSELSTDRDMPLAVAARVVRLIRVVEQEVRGIETVRNLALARYAEKDAEDKLVLVEGRPNILDVQSYAAEVEEFLRSCLEIDATPLNLTDLSYRKTMPPMLLLRLGPLFQDS